MGHLEYLALMGACLLLTLPLELLLGARVWRRPRRLALSLLPVVVVFGIWDVLMIRAGAWSYDARATTGILLPGGLPVEELVFFVVVPICGLLTYEAVGNVLRAVRRARCGQPVAVVLRDLRAGR